MLIKKIRDKGKGIHRNMFQGRVHLCEFFVVLFEAAFNMQSDQSINVM